MFKNIKLRGKLLIAFLVMSLTPFLVVGIISLKNHSKTLSYQAFSQLKNIRELKKVQIQNYFKERQGDMNILMQTVATLRQKAFEKLSTVQENKKAQIEAYFKKCLDDIKVFSNNYAVVTALFRFATAIDDAGNIDEGRYNYFDNEFGKSLKQIKETYGYEDLLLLTTSGKVVYSVKKESDLGQNVIEGKLKTSGIGMCFQNGLKGAVIQDFQEYPPANNQYIAFVAAPVVFEEELAGVVMLKLTKAPVNDIVQRRKGLGESGETYLAGNAYGRTGYRSDRVVKDGKFGEINSQEYVNEALEGKSGEMVKSLRTDMQIVSFDPLNIPGLNWAIITTVSLEEAIAPKLEGENEDYFARYLKEFGYYDLFLIYPDGNIFYTVTHESDYGTNLITGGYADSGLGRVFQKVLETRTFEFADFQPYAPSDNQPAAFAAQPLIHNNNIELIVALQFSIDPVNKIMLERSGMGKTGETYLVGSDNLMRSDSYLNPENYSVKASLLNPDKGRVNTKAAKNAFAGETGCNIITNYNGNRVLSAYTPITIWNTTWTLIAEIHETEAFETLKGTRLLMGTASVISAVLIIIAAFWMAGYIVKPVRQVISGLTGSADKLTLFASQVESASQSLSGGTSRQAASFEKISVSLEQISVMIQKNADNANQSNNLMAEVNQVVEQANHSMEELTRAMNDISSASKDTSNIINGINEIAFQTGLLSLNAAIEAARAGEVGVGFAVVAEEVRNLAMRTSDAATNTASLIETTLQKIKDGEDMLIKTNNAFEAVTSMSEKIGDLVKKIASGSREQSVGIGQISSATGEINTVTQNNASNAQESAAISEEMSQQAEQMRGFVETLIKLV